MSGEEMPDGMPLPDQMAYAALRNIYRSYHDKTISRDTAAAEKRRLRREYEQAKGSWEFWSRLVAHHAGVMKDTEAAKTACRKDPSAENALNLCNVIDGLSQGDSARPVIYSEHGANCPVCNRFFSAEHADRKPRYCEDCGCRLRWESKAHQDPL